MFAIEWIQTFSFFVISATTFKQVYKILMKTVRQQWGYTSGWSTNLTKVRTSLKLMNHKIEIILLHGGKVILRGWTRTIFCDYQGLITIAGAWILKIYDIHAPNIYVQGNTSNETWENLLENHYWQVKMILQVKINTGKCNTSRHFPSDEIYNLSFEYLPSIYVFYLLEDWTSYENFRSFCTV